MDKLINSFTSDVISYLCDVKDCENRANTYLPMKGFSIYFAICDDCKKKLYKELKQEFKNEMVD